MNAYSANPNHTGAKSTSTRLSRGLLQRACACGQHTGASGGDCEECKKIRQGILQRAALNPPTTREVPRIVHEVLRSPGEPLQATTRAFMQPRFGYDFSRVPAESTTSETPGSPLVIGPPDDRYEQEAEQIAATFARAPESKGSADLGYDFSQVRVHTDLEAARAASAVNALAFTVGNDIVLGDGQYMPESTAGKQLLAHELVHVIQQSAHMRSNRALIQRQPKTPEATKSAPTAGTAQKLDLISSKNGDPCACLIVIHNNERNALKTAALMNQFCIYNLLLLQPDNAKRRIFLPGHTKDTDPNELFPPNIARQCLNDPQSCRDFLTKKSGSTNPAEIEEFVQIQFFLAVSDCSKSFTLPVIALHNNDVEDTKNYAKKKSGAKLQDLKMDVDKRGPKAGSDQLNELKKRIKEMFSEDISKELTQKGKTNIFRWCVSEDLNRCHIGDPDNPDRVIWVTNEKDFEALRKKDVNVALQSTLPETKGAKSESETDLSTLFLVVRELLGTKASELIIQLTKDVETDINDILIVIDSLKKLLEFHDLTILDLWVNLLKILGSFLKLLVRLVFLMLAKGSETGLSRIRYLNIETPGEALTAQTDQERMENYRFIVGVLQEVGLNCCGTDPTVEKNIQKGLEIQAGSSAPASVGR